MNNETIIIYSKNTLDGNDINAIKSLVESKLDVKVSSIVENVDSKVLGGIIVNFRDYKFVLPDEIGKISTNEKKVVIESSRELSQNEKQQYLVYAHRKFPTTEDLTADYIIDTSIIAGVRIRFGDEEIDLTLDKIIDKAFSKI